MRLVTLFLSVLLMVPSAAYAVETTTLRADTTAYTSVAREFASGGVAAYGFTLAEPLSPYVADFAFSCWFKFDDVAVDGTIIQTGWDNGATDSGVRVMFDPTAADQIEVALQDYWNNEVELNFPTATNPLVAGTWYHLLVLVYADLSTHNSTKYVAVYVDGTAAGAAQAATGIKFYAPIVAEGANCVIGGSEGSVVDWEGELASIQYWEFTPVAGSDENITALFDATEISWISSQRRGYSEIVARGGRTASDLVHAWECTDAAGTSLLDSCGNNTGTEITPATAPSTAGPSQDLTATRQESVNKWTDSTSAQDFENSTTGTVPKLEVEVAQGQPGLLFSGAQYLQESAGSSAAAMHVIVHIDGQTWDGGNDEYCLLSYSDTSSAQDYFWIGIKDVGVGDARVVVESNDAGTVRTFTGGSSLPTTGVAHITYTGTTLYINGADDSATGDSATMPASLTNQVNLDTITLGAVEISGTPAKFANLMHILEARDYDAAVTAATLFTASEARYGINYGAADGLVSSDAELDTAVAAIISAGTKGNIYVDGDFALDSAVSADANTYLRILTGGKITTSAANTLTVLGSFRCDGDDDVAVGTSGTELILSDTYRDRIRVDWFTDAADEDKIIRALQCQTVSTPTLVYLDSTAYTINKSVSTTGVPITSADDGATIQGAGRGLTTLTSAAAQSGILMFHWAGTGGNVTIQDMTVDVNQQTDAQAFYADGSSSQVRTFHIRRCIGQNHEAAGNTKTAFYISGQSCTVKHCVVLLGRHGFVCKDGTNTYTCCVYIGKAGSGHGIDCSTNDYGNTVGVFERCLVEDVTTGAIKLAVDAEVTPTATQTVRNCAFTNSADHGWEYTGSDDVTATVVFENCVFDGMAGNGISGTASGATSLTFTLTDVTCNDCGNDGTGYGVFAQDDITLTATNLTITSGGDRGIGVAGTADIAITNLTMTGHAVDYGIVGGGTATTLSVTNGTVNTSKDNDYQVYLSNACTMTLTSVTFGDNGGADKGVQTNHASAVLYLYDCDLAFVAANHYTETLGKIYVSPLTWDSQAASSSWNTAANWDDALDVTPPNPPGLNCDVTFDGTAVDNCTLDVQPPTLGSFTATAAYTGTIALVNGGSNYNLTLADGEDLTLDCTGFTCGSGTITLSNGNFDNEGVTTYDDGTSTLVMSGTGNIVSSTSDDIYNLTVNAGTTTVTTNLDCQNAITIAGTLTTSSILRAYNVLTVGNGAFLSGAGLVRLQIPAAGEGLTTLHSNGTVDIATLEVLQPDAAAVLDGGTYGSALVKIRNIDVGAPTLTLSNEVYIFSGNLELENTGAGSLTLDNTNDPTITIVGNLVLDNNVAGDASADLIITDTATAVRWDVDGDIVDEITAGTLAYNQGTSYWSFTGSANQAIDFHGVDMGKVQIAKSSAGNITFSSGSFTSATASTCDDFTVTGDASFDLDNDTLTLNANHSFLADTSGTFDAGSGTIALSGTGWSFDNSAAALTYDDGTSTVSLSGTGDIVSSAANDIFNLTIGAGTTTATTDVDAAGTVAVSGSLSVANTKVFKSLTTATTTVADGARITGAGTYRISAPGNGEGLTLLHSGGTVDVAILEILKPEATAVIDGGTYGSALVKVINNATTAHTLTLNAETYTFSGNFELENVDPGGSLTLNNSANNPSFSFGGNVIWDQTAGNIDWTKGTGTITITGANSTLDFGGEAVEDIIINVP